jgi:hypothetical protein
LAENAVSLPATESRRYPHANRDAFPRSNVAVLRAKFEPSHIVATPVALEALKDR